MVYKLNGLQTPGWASVCSQVVWKNFLVLQVFLQGDAARHGGCELDVVHQAGTRVASEVFFDDLLPIQPIPVTRPVMVAASRRDLTSLLSDIGVRSVVYIWFKNSRGLFFKIRPRFALPTRSLVQSLLLLVPRVAPGEPFVLFRHCDFVLLG